MTIVLKRYWTTQGDLQSVYGDPCPYCERPMMGWRSPSRDHVIPKSKGGTLNDRNKLIVCSPCNNDKNNMTIGKFYKWLTWKRDPRAPIVKALIERRALEFSIMAKAEKDGVNA